MGVTSSSSSSSSVGRLFFYLVVGGAGATRTPNKLKMMFVNYIYSSYNDGNNHYNTLTFSGDTY